MTEVEITNAFKKIEVLGGMTINERLYLTGLIDEFDKAKSDDKVKARKISELLKVDTPSMNKILS